MAESPKNRENDAKTPQETSVCQRCGGTGFIETSGTFSYGDPGYGDPEASKMPCPDCQSAKNTMPTNQDAPEKSDGCMLVVIGIVVLVGLIVSVIIGLLR